jgi:class 3 adenylate cyclase
MNIELLQKRIEALKNRPGANTVAINAIENWLLETKLLQRLRINPYYLTDYSGLPVDAIISELLQGVKTGLFDLHWDVHCPHCNMITTEYHNLADASNLSLCPMCERQFEVDFLERVEVTFSLNKQIEDPQLSPVCAPPPALKAKCQLVTPFNETDSAVVTLEEGKYRYCCPLTCAKGILQVEGEATEELQIIQIQQLEGSHFDKGKLTVRPGKVRIELTNVGHKLSGAIVHEDELPGELALEQLPPRLSGLEIVHNPDYKHLFGDQVLSERERLKIRAVTLMFTDITSSTLMYERLGDTKAYNLVRDHFEILFNAIESHEGKVVKTIGDAVMASFVTNQQALQAAVEAFRQFGDYNRDRNEAERIRVKIGIHRGSAMLVNLNEKLDYFGSIVNKAARIQTVSKSHEISFSEEVYRDRAFVSALREAGISGIQKHLEDLKGIDGKQVVYTARINLDGFISAINVLV